MADQIWPNGSRLLDANGDPLSGAKVYAYESGTATLMTIYTDSTLTVAGPNPVQTDAQGLIPPMWHDGSVDVKVNATDAADVVLNGFPIDPAPSFKGGSAANDISFTATPDVPANSVQGAIEHVGSEVTTLEGAMTTAEADIVALEARDLSGLVPIASATASDTAAIEFTQFDHSKYHGYVFRFVGVVPATGGQNLGVRFSSDGGTTFISTADYKWAGSEVIAGSGANGRWSSSTTSITIARQPQTNGNGVHGRLEIYDPGDADQTHATFHTSYHTTDATALSGSGRHKTLVAIDAIQFLFDSGNITSGTIIMAGLAR
jgi:hypothetical protein